MTDLSAIDYKENVRRVVRRRLKEIGIKVPKSKARQDKLQFCNENASTVFGVPLEKLPLENISCDFYCSVPRFLVEATDCLENHLGSEGLFRKSGSSVRQKQLKKIIEDGGEIFTAQPHDVASLLKQFFRELPEPLLTNQLHDSFLKCLLLGRKNEQTMAVLLLCILLPISHLSTLQYFVKFIARVALKSEESKMGTSNLAIVLTPNLMHTSSKKENSNGSEKLLREQTSVIQILLENAQEIGMIPDDIICEAKTLDCNAEGGFSSCDELDGDKVGLRSRHKTNSISGFVSGFGNKVNKFRNSSSRTQSHHRRSKSVKADISRHKRNIVVDIKAKDDSAMFTSHLLNGELSALKDGKRKPVGELDKELTPAGKRKMTGKEQSQIQQCQVISSPFSVTSSTQMFMTPKRPIQRTRPQSEKAPNGRKDVSHETEHVKVVDARHYESPEALRPGSISLEFTKLLNQSSTGDKYVFDSPLDVDLSSASNAKTKRAQAKRHGRTRTKRRNSSGATRCFSSSPRSRNHKISKKTSPKGTRRAAEDSHGSVGTLSVSSAAGEHCNLLDESPWHKHVDKETPRRNTPPIPHLAGKSEFRAIFSENLF